MPSDVQELLRSLIEADYRGGKRQRDTSAPPPIVTLSRDLGAGGREVALRLSQRLGVAIWDRRILDAVAASARTSPELMAKLDDRVKAGSESWLYNLLSGQNAFLTTYRHHLVNVALALAERGGVIVGRGAHLILANRPAFRLRLVGTPEACANRVAVRESVDYEDALAQVNKINRERDEFLWNAFRHRLDEIRFFDLVINTDRFEDRWDDVAAIVVDAGVRCGLWQPGSGPEST